LRQNHAPISRSRHRHCTAHYARLIQSLLSKLRKNYLKISFPSRTRYQVLPALRFPSQNSVYTTHLSSWASNFSWRNKTNNNWWRAYIKLHDYLMCCTSLLILVQEKIKFNLNNNYISGLEDWEYGHRDPSRWPRDALHPQNLALSPPTSGGRSVGIIRSQTKATELVISI
jgi:hypothetical protein